MNPLQFIFRITEFLAGPPLQEELASIQQQSDRLEQQSLSLRLERDQLEQQVVVLREERNQMKRLT